MMRASVLLVVLLTQISVGKKSHGLTMQNFQGRMKERLRDFRPLIESYRKALGEIEVGKSKEVIFKEAKMSGRVVLEHSVKISDVSEFIDNYAAKVPPISKDTVSETAELIASIREVLKGFVAQLRKTQIKDKAILAQVRKISTDTRAVLRNLREFAEQVLALQTSNDKNLPDSIEHSYEEVDALDKLAAKPSALREPKMIIAIVVVAILIGLGAFLLWKRHRSSNKLLASTSSRSGASSSRL